MDLFLLHLYFQFYFIIYDILPILHPEWWPSHIKALHSKWLETIVNISDGLLSISNAVSYDVQKWIDKNNIKKSLSLKHMCFHLGADIDNSLPSNGMPENGVSVLEVLKNKTTFLMVGTIEPRKGHEQTLEAFEQLWQDSLDVNLVYVGKEGWLVEEIIQKMRNHPELNKRFFWLEGISDEYLEKVYENSTCLIAASEGEGFGLPLIEAAQKKMPIIARDIPVFKEVAGEFACYFENSKDSEVTVTVIKHWIELYKQNTHPKSDEMPWLTWEESARQLLDCVGIKYNKKVIK